jgi:hypothetical protein
MLEIVVPMVKQANEKGAGIDVVSVGWFPAP